MDSGGLPSNGGALFYRDTEYPLIPCGEAK